MLEVHWKEGFRSHLLTSTLHPVCNFRGREAGNETEIDKREIVNSDMVGWADGRNKNGSCVLVI